MGQAEARLRNEQLVGELQKLRDAMGDLWSDTELLQVGPSPISAKNACYFFNRVESSGEVRFVSYQFSDRPEFTAS